MEFDFLAGKYHTIADGLVDKCGDILWGAVKRLSGCLSPGLVSRYVAGNCTADERLKVERHTAVCESCRGEVELRRVDRTMTFTQQAGASDYVPTVKRYDGDESPTIPMTQATQPESATPIPTRTEDSMFENYKIVEEMPRGGQAVVYKAIHEATKTNVAIKVLLPSLLPSARARYYFEREAELIASLDHPNIVKIRDSGIIHAQYYFVMEYIQGVPLNRHAELQELPFRERILLFKKVCEAVSYAHQQGIIHRDLKSGNILVDERGEPHILDFGLAKAVSLSEETKKGAMPTITGQWGGTLLGMSPEQASGRPELIDVRTDVYSLGVILYHLLMERYPYDVDGSMLEALQNIQTVEPIRPRQLISKFDSDVEAILLTTLAKDRAQRYQSVADLISDIENWLEGRPIRVRSISTWYVLRKIMARHRYASAVVGLVLVIILAFSYVSFDMYRMAKKAQKESEATARQWRAEADLSLALSRQIAFTFFLDAYRENRKTEAGGIVNFLSPGSKERKAAVFLMSAASLARKEEEFRRSLSEELIWFADFVVGEHHLKAGNRKEAAEYYRRSYQAAKELIENSNTKSGEWLMNQVAKRLRQVNTSIDSDEKVHSAEDGDR